MTDTKCQLRPPPFFNGIVAYETLYALGQKLFDFPFKTFSNAMQWWQDKACHVILLVTPFSFLFSLSITLKLITNQLFNHHQFPRKC